MRTKTTLILLTFLFVLVACDDTTLYNFDEQLRLDVALIDEYLESRNITHETDPTGIRFEILSTTQAEGIGSLEYGLFEITIWLLNGEFLGSNNPDIDRTNGGDGQFRVRASYVGSGRFGGTGEYYYSESKYLSVIGSRIKLGEQYRLYVPSGYAFGFEPPAWQDRAVQIPSNANLVIEITLSEIRN